MTAIFEEVQALCTRAKAAAPTLAAASTQQKNLALMEMAAQLESQTETILAANDKLA